MIEFLFWQGCPSHERALANLVRVMDDHGLERSELRITEIHNERDCLRERFIGSPTIRLDDLDLDPEAVAAAEREAGDDAFGLNCRVYVRRDGRASPLPDPDDLIAAVAGYAAAQRQEPRAT